MKVLGLTGGVGMGKSTAAGFLLAAGIRVVDTDEIARALVQPGQPALAEIQKEFGPEMISATGELKRDQLARLVFADTGARQRLEAILHPRIRAAWESQIEAWRADQCPLAVVVIPLLFETQAQDRFDKIICVACGPASQQERLRARQWSPEQIGQRIAAQMPVTQKIALSRFVVWTEGLPEVHRRQITEILRKV
jgi:dephospho-CoA kinase